MQFIICENYDEISKTAARIMEAQIKTNPKSVLGLATGSTPVGMYKELIRMHQQDGLDFSAIQSYNLDEYYPIDPTNDQSYRYFMNANLFDHVNIDKANTHVPCGSADVDPEISSKEYDAALDNCGGIDIQILGIGENGHIGFNEPDASLVAGTHVTDLTQNTIEVNARFFEKIEDVPKKAITMGMASIFKAKKILLLISGAKKHAVTKELLHDGITTSVPATFLKLHSGVVVICDKAAYYGA